MLIIFTFILGSLIFCGVGVAASELLASSIKYEPEWKKSNGDNITNVSEAIDELYNKATDTRVATQVATLTTQGATYTMQHDGYVIGTAAPTQSDKVAFLEVDNKTLILTNEAYYGTRDVSVYAPKGSVVKTRDNYGTYNLTVYEWK